MKKITVFLVLLLTCLTFTGCTTTNVNPGSSTLIVQSAGQVFGYKFAQQNPTLIDPAIAIATSLTADNVTEAMVTAAVQVAAQQFANNPLMQLQLTNLIKLVQLQVSGTSVQTYDMTLVRAGAQGFIEGIQLFQQAVH